MRMYRLKEWISQLDTWLCLNLPFPVRIWWQELWIRADIQHVSLGTDPVWYCPPALSFRIPCRYRNGAWVYEYFTIPLVSKRYKDKYIERLKQRRRRAYGIAL